MTSIFLPVTARGLGDASFSSGCLSALLVWHCVLSDRGTYAAGRRRHSTCTPPSSRAVALAVSAWGRHLTGRGGISLRQQRQERPRAHSFRSKEIRSVRSTGTSRKRRVTLFRAVHPSGNRSGVIHFSIAAGRSRYGRSTGPRLPRLTGFFAVTVTDKNTTCAFSVPAVPLPSVRSLRSGYIAPIKFTLRSPEERCPVLHAVGPHTPEEVSDRRVR